MNRYRYPILNVQFPKLGAKQTRSFYTVPRLWCSVLGAESGLKALHAGLCFLHPTQPKPALYGASPPPSLVFSKLAFSLLLAIATSSLQRSARSWDLVGTWEQIRGLKFLKEQSGFNLSEEPIPHGTHPRYRFLPDNTAIPLSHLVYFSNPDVYPFPFFVRISGEKDQGTRTDSFAPPSPVTEMQQSPGEYHGNLEAVPATILTD